jgi:hypothetical protein
MKTFNNVFHLTSRTLGPLNPVTLSKTLLLGDCFPGSVMLHSGAGYLIELFFVNFSFRLPIN